ncbi:ATP-binding protein [Candidatus Pelagibacter sp.]|jgi:anti-sigma regulatory factor (Ser/Thr protein kinase)|nr:ATP-binding protein [Candidatus Pelagibacter sp.]MDC0863260.1 ATP-binding protein [Candidatus Pelagibacter sp.]|tara:strand:+ start:1028 stop:1450 length:423 start_codon:yes stop_codon:yes gene_type:complete
MSFIQHADFGITSSSLKEVRNFCREIFKKNQELENEQEKLILVISEAVQNIIKHAYENKDSAEKMRLKISYDNNELRIDLYDKGKLVIEENVKPRDLDDIKPGGLGTFYIKQVMDEVIFSKEKTDDWINHLILKKKIITQ